MLGIIIGVSAVVVMITLGNGSTQAITERISSLGSNILFIFPSRVQNVGGASRKLFSLNEISTLELRTQGIIRAVAPFANTSLLVHFRQESVQTQIQGVNASYFTATNWNLLGGSGFESQDYRAGSNSCIIGASVKKNLFDKSNINPLGSRIRLNNIVCECVGVLEEKGQGAMGNDQDDVILLPLKTYQRSIAKSKSLQNIQRIMVSLKDGVDSTQAVEQIQQEMREIRRIRSGQNDDFEIMDTKQIIQVMQSTTASLTLFLGAIAGVSLIVGGIGIMNIMLVSITERTKEIGARIAIGAMQSEVLLQFLIEAVVLSALGGVIGIILAFFASLGFCYALELPFNFDYSIALVAFVFSVFIGILFGYLPARRASRLNPIDALRHE
ncbi:MAG: ABC transporter permease [Helicobacter sp.]|nr:ABC transporter permease [Helicobacter sp.]